MQIFPACHLCSFNVAPIFFLVGGGGGGGIPTHDVLVGNGCHIIAQSL